MPVSSSSPRRATSFFGDLHPSFHGNVVKAMASAKQGYGIVTRRLARVAPASSLTDAAFFAKLDADLRPTVERVERLTPKSRCHPLRRPKPVPRPRPLAATTTGRPSNLKR